MNSSNSASLQTQVPVSSATKKGLFNFESKFKYSGKTNPNVIFAHEIGHGVAYLQNPGITSTVLTVFPTGDGLCEHKTTPVWRDHAKLQDCAEYQVAGCVFQYLYTEGDLSVEALYQKWLGCPNAAADREILQRDLKSVKAERTEQIVRAAIATAKTRFSQLGVDYINQLINQASVQKGNKVLTLIRP